MEKKEKGKERVCRVKVENLKFREWIMGRKRDLEMKK